MSWDSYRDTLVQSHCSQAAIIGLEDGGVWAASEGLNISPEQVAAIREAFTNSAGLQSNGIRIGCTKYMYIQSDHQQIQGKKGPSGVSICKTNLCIVIGIYGDGIQPGNCRLSVEKISDHLRNTNY